MIIGNPYEIAIHIEQIDFLCSPSGIFNFIINDTLIPGKGVTVDLYIVISSLKESLESGLENLEHTIEKRPIEKIDFSDGNPKGFISLNVAELHDYGCVFWLGFNDNKDRLIYSLDFEKTFSEVYFSHGTVEKLVKKLPKSDNLIMDKADGVIITRLADN
ncbi:Imm42 family immunity protein [Erwinia aphidicola]|uniref:Imm42 family immunity protein n=1 Tax=Erwinia aphidicola TaxID=68334 RepID=UPI0016546741